MLEQNIREAVVRTRTDATPRIRQPNADDGRAVHALIARCPPLDENSLYGNLLQCTHFAETCALAERRGRICGFVSAYVVPAAPQRLFIWQVAVAHEARGQRLGGRMVQAILARPACRHVRELHTTVTPDNAPSAAMFASLARRLEAPLRRRILFDRDRHFAGEHASEVLLEIGPFTPPRGPRVGLV